MFTIIGTMLNVLLGLLFFGIFIYYYTKYPDGDKMEKTLTFLILAIIICAVFIGLIYIPIVGISTEHKQSESDQIYSIYSCDAPTGTYWVEQNINGKGGLFFFKINTNADLKMSYTIQYTKNINNNTTQLETVIISSEDQNLNVYFVPSNDTRCMTINLHTVTKYSENCVFDHPIGKKTTQMIYNVYLPNDI